MTRLLGRLFGGDAGKGQALLRAYGKLPLYAEYRRLELSPGAPIAFSQWLDAGRLAWVRSPTKSAAASTRPSRLLIQLPDTKEAVVASVWDSRDSLGRVFPFAFFVTCPLSALGDSAVERWVAATEIHHRFDAFHTQLHSLGSGGDFYRLYGKHMIRLRSDDSAERSATLRAKAADIAADPWFKALPFDDELASAAWFSGLHHRAEHWRAQPDALGELALSCPLARGYSHDVQAVLWLEWLDGLLEKARRTPALVVPIEGAASAPLLHVVVRDLLADDYQLLTTDDGRYDFSEKLSLLPATGSDGAALPVDEPPSGSLLAWLREHAA